MRYMFDPRTGRVRGAFEVNYDFEGEELEDGSFETDLLAFSYAKEQDRRKPVADRAQLYIDFANIAWPPSLPLLEEDYTVFDKRIAFQLPQPDETTCDENRLFDFAEAAGPLFGVFDEGVGHIAPEKILEPESCWYDAAKTLSLAVRIQAYLAGRAKASDLDDAIHFILHSGGGEKDFYWECASFYPGDLDRPYWDMLELSEKEQARLFLPASETAWPGLTFLTRFDPRGPGKWNHSALSVSAIPDKLTGRTVPYAYTTFNYLASKPETEALARVLAGHLLRGLVLLHTHRVHHDLLNGYFGVVYNNLLERLWIDFAADAALGKLGVCPQCGKVFEALSERRDTKRYCSTTCQANAKSTRQYRRRKIRQLAAGLGRRPTLEEAQNAANSYEVTEEMIDTALKKT